MNNNYAAPTKQIENASKKLQRTRDEESLRINLVLRGEPALEALELKKLGFVRNNADLVSQAVAVLY